jgi:hypothetical protein
MSITKLTTNGIVGAKYDTVSADNYYMEPIATNLLGSTTASVTFSNIPQNYKHLQIRGLARGTTADTSVLLRFQLNSDTGSNYARHILTGDGSTAGAAVDASQTVGGIGNIAAATATASIFGVVVCDILDYANVYKFKTIRSLAGNDRNGAGVVGLFSSLWMNTAAITSVSIFPAANSFDTNTRFSLYGIRG